MDKRKGEWVEITNWQPKNLAESSIKAFSSSCLLGDRLFSGKSYTGYKVAAGYR